MTVTSADHSARARKLDEIQARKTVHFCLVIVPAQNENDVRTAQGLDELLPVGHGIEAEVESHDDGNVLRNAPQVMTQQPHGFRALLAGRGNGGSHRTWRRERRNGRRYGQTCTKARRAGRESIS